LRGASVLPQLLLESWKSPLVCALVNRILTLPELIALTFFALLRLPNFAVKPALPG
jgi:hypothetical protein